MKPSKAYAALYLPFLFFSLACQSKDDLKNRMREDKVIERMKSLSSLGTVEYGFNKLIKCSDEQIYSIGDRKIVMSCKAYAKAGVNFEKITIHKIDYENKSIEINLPKGELILLNIPAEDIKLENAKTGFFRWKFSNQEIQNIQVLAEKEIKQKLKEFKITEKAEANAAIFLDKWIRTFGFQNVNISIN